MSLNDVIESIAGGPLRGWARFKGTGKKDEMMKYLEDRSDIKKYVDANPQYKDLLAQKLDEASEKYGQYREGRTVGKGLQKTFDALGVAGDAYFFRNPIGGLGVKAVATAGSALADLYGLVEYSVKSGDYFAIPRLLAAKVASYVPGVHEIVDSSLDGLIQRRVLHEAKNSFLKEVKAKETLEQKDGYMTQDQYKRHVFKPRKDAFDIRRPAQTYQHAA